MNVYREPEYVRLHSAEYGRHFEYPMTSVGPKPDEIDFGGDSGGDFIDTDAQAEPTIRETELIERPHVAPTVTEKRRLTPEKVSRSFYGGWNVPHGTADFVIAE